MKYYKFFLLITVCFFVACNNIGIEETTTKQEYIDKLEKLSDKARKEQLTKDIAYLTTLLKTTRDLKVYNKNVSKKTDDRSDVLDAAKLFELVNVDSTKVEFGNLNEAKVVQKYGIPNSSFDIQIQDSLTFIDQAQLLYQTKSAYLKGEAIDPSTISLATADSILTSINYEFVTSVDTISILASSKTDSIAYKKSIIDIIEQSEKTIKVVYPINLKLVDYRAIAATGGLPMLYQTSSDFSIFSISTKTESILQHLIDVLTDASIEVDKSLALAKLQSLSDDEFDTYNTLRNFKKVYDDEILKHANNAINNASEMPVEFIKEYEVLLSPVSKELTLTFDKPYSRVMLYVASKYKTLSKDVMALVDKDSLRDYNIYRDGISKRYGIVDKNAKIVIPAIYDKLLQDDDLYYRASTNMNNGKQDVLSFLDTIQKILRPLPADLTFVKVLNPNTTVFENRKGKKGVLSKNKVEIIPYRYDDIVLHGKTIIAKGTTANDLFYELFNISGKKINLPQIKSVNFTKDNPTVIVKASDGKEGFINKDGVATIRPHYYGLKLINDDLLKYNTDATYDEYSAKDYLWGIVKTDGEEVVKPQYYSIGFFSEDMAPVYIKNGDALRGGYINSTGEITIEPKYLYANEFYKGYALVRVLENYCLIDKGGKIVKNFPKGTYVELVNYSDPSKGLFYETSDGIDFDYQGKPIK